jgi:hypothetical protein
MLNFKKHLEALGNLWNKFEFSKVQTPEEDLNPYGKFIEEINGDLKLDVLLKVHINRFSKGTMVDITHGEKNVFHKFILDESIQSGKK